MKPAEVDLDGIIEEIGHIGKYQVKQFLWAIIPVVVCSLHASNYIFTTPDVTYRCRIPECDGNSSSYDTDWMSNAIPKGEKCSRYPLTINSSWTQPLELECPADQFDQNQKTSCDEYIFEEENTFLEEMNIPCQSWKRTLIGTMHSLGTLLALPLIGSFSDRFGRKYALVVASMLEGVLGIVKSLSVNYGMFIAMEMLEPTLGSGVYSSAYILALEALTPSTRVAASILINIYFATGQVLMGALAWAIPYWRTYLQIIYAPSLLLFVYYWIFDESMRWLMSKRKYQETIDVLRKIAKENNKQLTDKALENLQFNVDNAEHFINDSVNEKETEHKKDSLFRQVFTSKILVLRVLKASVWWITCAFCFYGLAINSVVLQGNKYTNFILSAAAEYPAHIIGYFALTRFGRKRTLFMAFLIGGLSLVGFPFVPEDLSWLSIVLFLIGKGCVSLAFGAVYLYTSELFPTPLRHSLLATCSMIGRIGSILAPQTPLLAEIYAPFPSFLFAGCCLISAALMLTSPETLNQKLPETVEDAEQIGSRANLIN